MEGSVREITPVFKKLVIQGWKPRVPTWAEYHTWTDRQNQTYVETWHVGLRILELNSMVASLDSRSRNVTRGILGRDAVPRGLRVYQCPSVITPDVIEEIRSLYGESIDLVPRRDPRDNIIFLRWPVGTQKEEGAPTLATAHDILLGLKKTHLRRVLAEYVLALQHIFHADTETLLKSSMSIVRYNGKDEQGIRPHIDNFNVSQSDMDSGAFRHKLGPLVTIALMPTTRGSKKKLDFMPVVKERASCVRVEVQQGDILIMDGEARLEYAHSVPNETTERYSLCFKFPQDGIEQHYYGEFSDVLQTAVLYSIPLPGEKLMEIPREKLTLWKQIDATNASGA